MLEGIPLPILGSLGASGLVVLTVILILTGRLIPKRFYDDAIHDRNEALASGRIKDVQLAKKDEQIDHLLEVGETVKAVMRSVQARASEAEPS